jgi:hypothetical protein
MPSTTVPGHNLLVGYSKAAATSLLQVRHPLWPKALLKVRVRVLSKRESGGNAQAWLPETVSGPSDRCVGSGT